MKQDSDLNLYDRIKDLIQKWSSRNKAVKPEDTFSELVGIYGDEAASFLEEYSTIFSIDFDGFNFLDYFEPESSLPFWGYFIVIPMTVVVLVHTALELLLKSLGISYKATYWNKFRAQWCSFFKIKELKEITLAELFLWAKKGKWYDVPHAELAETIENLNSELKKQ